MASTTHTQPRRWARQLGRLSRITSPRCTWCKRTKHDFQRGQGSWCRSCASCLRFVCLSCLRFDASCWWLCCKVCYETSETREDTSEQRRMSKLLERVQSLTSPPSDLLEDMISFSLAYWRKWHDNNNPHPIPMLMKTWSERMLRMVRAKKMHQIDTHQLSRVFAFQD